MSANKKNRSLWGSRSEAQRIYYQRQTIKRLEKENNQLKEQRKELRSWLEKEIDEYGNSDAWLLEIGVIKNVLSKINELEGGKNERSINDIM